MLHGDIEQRSRWAAATAQGTRRGSLAEISGTDISEGKLPLHPKAMGRMAAEVGSIQLLPTPAAGPLLPLVFCTPGDKQDLCLSV